MRPYRIITDYIFTQFQLSYRWRFFPNYMYLHLIVNQSLNPWESQYLASCIMWLYVSNKFEVSIRLSDLELLNWGRSLGIGLQIDWESQKHVQTEWMQCFVRPLEGYITSFHVIEKTAKLDPRSLNISLYNRPHRLRFHIKASTYVFISSR